MTVEHRFASQSLQAYHEQTLAAGEDERVREHLRVCTQCRASLAELTELAGDLRALRTRAPDGLGDRVIARLDAESAAARLSVVSTPVDESAPHMPAASRARAIVRAQLPRTLALSFVIGVAITLLKDLGTLLSDGITVQTCAVFGANFVAAFALLNVWLLLPRPRPWDVTGKTQTLTSSAPSERARGRRNRARDACAYCGRPQNLRRTVKIAFVVGVSLTAINQGGLVAAGQAMTLTWVRCGLNFVVPFLVSNAGLLSGRR